MIITKLKGGLGNQMFQYAVGRSLAEKNNINFAMDLSGYKNQNPKDTPRDYSLGIFNVLEKFASAEDIKKYKLNKWEKKIRKILGINKGYVIEKNQEFDEQVLKIKDNAYLDGYWQCEKYFLDIKDIIYKDFSLKNPLPEKVKDIEKQISETNSISIHIRRGDYITNKNAQQHHGSCGLEYYKQAVEIIEEETEFPHFFVFSDDIEWCKENVKADKISYVSDGNMKDYEEMYLMAKCKHNIIANSSFSWWGAWLNQNPDKIVIAPKKWLNNPKINTDDIVPKTWLKI